MGQHHEGVLLNDEISVGETLVQFVAVLVNDVIEVTASEVPYAGNVRPVGGDLYAISPLEDETHKVLAYSICAAACVIFLAFETVCDA